MRAIISRYLIFLWLIQIAIPFTPVVYTEEKTDAITLSQGAGAGLPVLFIASLCASVFSSNKEWVGGTDSTWNTAGNWNPSGVPATTDSVILDSNATKNCGLNAAGSVKKFTIKSNFTRTFYQLTNTLTVGSGNFSQAGGTFTGGNSAITINGVDNADRSLFTVSGGTFTHNNGKLRFNHMRADNDTTLITVGAALGHKLSLGYLNFDGRRSNNSTYYCFITAGDTLEVTKNYSHGEGAQARTFVMGGVVLFKGDTIRLSVSAGGNNSDGEGELSGGGTTKIIVSGDKAQYYKTISTGGYLSKIEINTTDTLRAVAGTGYLGMTDFTLTKGGFSAPTDSMIVQGWAGDNIGDFTVNGGTFTHNNGLVMFRHTVAGSKSCVVSTSLSSNKITFGSLWFNTISDGGGGDNTYTISSGDTVLATGAFKVLGGGGAYDNNVNTGVIEAQGDVTLSGGSKGTASLVFTGANAQTFTFSGLAMFSGAWEVKKSSGTVVMGSAITFPGKLRITSGAFSNGTTYKLTTGDSLVIGASGIYVDTGSGGLTLAGPVGNSGRVIINSNGGGCGSNDSIFIRSSVNGTRRNWGGSGIFQIIDIKIRDMSSTPAITAYSSTDSLNNTTNWTIDANCYVPSITNVRPAAAKRTAIVTMNGTGFLAAQGTGQIVIGTIGLGTAQSWSATAIVDTVPVTATFGTNNAIITNTCVGKDTAIFRVTNPGITIP